MSKYPEYDSYETSDEIIDALNDIAAEDGTTFEQLWEDGYTEIHDLLEIRKMVIIHILQNVPAEKLYEMYYWGEEIIRTDELAVYNTMYDYVKDADFSEYEIMDGVLRECPFFEEIKPANDPNFFISSDVLPYGEKWYRKVNFGEKEESYILESELYDTVYLIYIEKDTGDYVPFNGRPIETQKEAEKEVRELAE